MLRDGNYSVWKWGCRTLLKEYEIWDVVSGESKRITGPSGKQRFASREYSIWVIS
jgi:hypothetical protein